MISILFILLKGNIMSTIQLGAFDFDLVTIILTYLLICYGQTGAGLFAFGQGLLIDIYSAGFFGLFTFLYLSVFLGIKFGCLFFEHTSRRGLIFLVSLAVLFKAFIFSVMMKAFSFEITISLDSVLSSIIAASINGIVAPVIFYLLHQCNHFIMGEERENT